MPEQMNTTKKLNQFLCRAALLTLSLIALSACQSTAPATSNTTAQYLLLGEVHDNSAGHQARLETIRQALLQDKSMTMVLEQFDTDQQAALDEAQRVCSTADCLLQKLRKPGLQWQWPLYQPLIQLALDQKIPMIAGNLSREQARRVMKEGYGAVFDAATLKRWQLRDNATNNNPPDLQPHHTVLQMQQQEVIQAHCGQLPLTMAEGMAKAQMARDIVMADKLLQHSGRSILIAGNGHVRKDIGVAYWLRFAGAKPAHSHVYAESAIDAAAADAQTQISKQARPDPCAGLIINSKPKETP